MENGAFAPLGKCSIFHNIFKSIQKLYLYFFNVVKKIENDVMI